MNKILLFFLLVGCNKYKGEMNVTDHLIYKNTRGKTQVLVIGDYETNLKIRKNKNITIKAKNLFENVKIKLKLQKPMNEYISTENVEQDVVKFEIPKSATNQPFRVVGELRTTVEMGEEKTVTQVCSNHPRWDIDCHWQYRDPVGNPFGYGPFTFCMGIPTGTREMTYRDDLTKANVVMDLINEETANATVKASSEKTKRVVLSVSPCTL